MIINIWRLRCLFVAFFGDFDSSSACRRFSAESLVAVEVKDAMAGAGILHRDVRAVSNFRDCCR